MYEKSQFWIGGLDCAEEVLLLKKAMGRLPGVENLDFDVINAKMVVTHDPRALQPAAIIDAVGQTGLTARLWSERVQNTQASWWQRHRRALLTMLSGVLLIGGFAAHALSSGSAAALGIDSPSPGERGLMTVPMTALVLYLASILSGLAFSAPKAWASLRRLRPDMSLLMCTAVAGAIGIDEWFEAATVSFLFSLALLLEHWSMDKTRRAIAALLDLSPPTAQCLDVETGRVRNRPVAEVPISAIVTVRPHERIPLDGRVVKGTSSVNEAPITGESLPVAKQTGDPVYAGTINEQSPLEFEVTHKYNETTLARIVHMVEEAQARRAPMEQWVETFAHYYTPTMMILAAAVFVFSPPLLGVGWSVAAYRALVLLVIACPCALVISTPVSIVSGLAAAARHGVLVKGGRYLEVAARLDAVALDKTGTLTHGRPVVQQLVALSGHTEKEVLQRAAAMEQHSRHPMARAILRRADEGGIEPMAVENYRVLSGRGAEGVFSGKPFWIGSHRMMHEAGGETPEVHDRAVAMEDAGHTVVAIGNADHVCGLIGIADELRAGVAETIAELKRIGIRHVAMLTGDNAKTAGEVARIVRVDRYRADLLPEDKVREIHLLREEYKSVAMLGDGINDAPAMAASNLGIAMGAIGSDTAIETADIALMADDLSKLPWLIIHARRTLATVKQNIAFALTLKLVFVALAFAGLASLWMAIAADMGASLLVIANGLRLLRA